MLEMNLDLNEKETIEFNLENGSTSGTSNYEELKNKPSINGNELVGNKTTEELGILNDVEEYIKENKADFKGEPGEQGLPGEPGVQGEPGYTPVRGTDYWTSEDINVIETYINNSIDAKITNELESDF